MLKCVRFYGIIQAVIIKRAMPREVRKTMLTEVERYSKAIDVTKEELNDLYIHTQGEESKKRYSDEVHAEKQAALTVALDEQKKASSEASELKINELKESLRVTQDEIDIFCPHDVLTTEQLGEANAWGTFANSQAGSKDIIKVARVVTQQNNLAKMAALHLALSGIDAPTPAQEGARRSLLAAFGDSPSAEVKAGIKAEISQVAMDKMDVAKKRRLAMGTSRIDVSL